MRRRTPTETEKAPPLPPAANIARSIAVGAQRAARWAPLSILSLREPKKPTSAGPGQSHRPTSKGPRFLALMPLLAI